MKPADTPSAPVELSEEQLMQVAAGTQPSGTGLGVNTGGGYFGGVGNGNAYANGLPGTTRNGARPGLGQSTNDPGRV
jgi:hypothetical protein